ncbi:50S ribosomal protein L22, partial [Candidatus Saccharibacteria bacterium RIFCSPHIGHO2_12_FULL_47_17]
AEYRSARVSPRKASDVAALVRGRSVNDALTILDHTPRRAASTIKKVIVSAKANAVHNHSYKPDSLFISEISVGAGIRLKRYRPAARGRALPYQHKTSHIKVLVDGEKRQAKTDRAKAAAKKETD